MRKEDALALDVLGWIVLGLIAGALARFVMPGKDPGGVIVTALLGIAGALLAGYFGMIAGFYDIGQRAGFIAAVVGSLVILTAYRLLTRPR